MKNIPRSDIEIKTLRTGAQDPSSYKHQKNHAQGAHIRRPIKYYVRNLTEFIGKVIAKMRIQLTVIGMSIVYGQSDMREKAQN